MVISPCVRCGTIATASALLAAAVLLAPASARAAFPGADGLIAFHAGRSIFTVKPSGGRPTKLPEDVPGFGGLSVSADATRIVYDDSHALHVMDADGRHPRRLTAPGAPFSDDPTFSPDGKHIAYERDDGIWVIKADGSGAHTITPQADFAHADHDPAWSPDGRRIAYTSQQQVWVMNADGSAAVSLTPPVLTCDKMTRRMSGAQPDWSPDGARIAFTGPVTCANSRGTDLWVMNADGSGQLDLIGDELTEDTDPVFSPDGARIAFTRWDASDAPRLMTIPAGGGAPTAVDIAASEVAAPVWGRALTTVRVREKVSRRHVRVHGRVRISGTVRPAETGKVSLAITRNGRRLAHKRARLSHRRYRITYRPSRPGRYRVAATLPTGHGHLEARSAARTFVVER
jgi:Tol biopolymer transport system component